MPEDARAAPTSGELRAVNERLLLAGLHERDLAEQLRRQLAFTSAIADNLGEGVYACDRAGAVTFVNPAAERLLGWSQAELLGRDAHEAIRFQRADGPLLAAVRSGAAYRSDDDAITRRDGSLLPVAYSVAPIVAGADVVGAVVAFRDVTERKRVEAERAALLAQVEAALAFRTRFLSITAHELKTPLAAIKGNAQLLAGQARRRDDEALAAPLGRIVQQVDGMTRLIDDLLDVARIESGQLAFDRRPFDLNAALREAVADVRMSAPDFALCLDERARGVRVSGDRPRIQQVLTNLLTNAVKYSGRRRDVDIALRRDGDWAVVAVTDYGIGIPAGQRAAIFEPYTRGANTQGGHVKGLGLGLFISKAIVDRHGGTLDLVSAEGLGSTFSLSLPTLATGTR